MSPPKGRGRAGAAHLKHTSCKTWPEGPSWERNAHPLRGRALPPPSWKGGRDRGESPGSVMRLEKRKFSCGVRQGENHGQTTGSAPSKALASPCLFLLSFGHLSILTGRGDCVKPHARAVLPVLRKEGGRRGQPRQPHPQSLLHSTLGPGGKTLGWGENLATLTVLSPVAGYAFEPGCCQERFSGRRRGGWVRGGGAPGTCSGPAAPFRDTGALTGRGPDWLRRSREANRCGTFWRS